MVEWRDPPDLRHRPGVWIDRLSPVMKRPGKWAMFWTCSTVEEAGVLSRQLRNRKRAIPPGKWLFTYGAADQGGEVFAMYVGPD